MRCTRNLTLTVARRVQLDRHTAPMTTATAATVSAFAALAGALFTLAAAVSKPSDPTGDDPLERQNAWLKRQTRAIEALVRTIR